MVNILEEYLYKITNLAGDSYQNLIKAVAFFFAEHFFGIFLSYLLQAISILYLLLFVEERWIPLVIALINYF